MVTKWEMARASSVQFDETGISGSLKKKDTTAQHFIFNLPQAAKFEQRKCENFGNSNAKKLMKI